MKIDEYIWVMCEAIDNDGDVSIFFILDEMIKFLSRCRVKEKVDMLKCLQRCHSIIDEIEQLIYGDVKHGRLYQFRTMDDFYNECQIINNQMKLATLDDLYRRACKELDDFYMIYSNEFNVNANGNVIDEWLKTVPDEAYHPNWIQCYL